MAEHLMKFSDPWFSLIRDGKKKIEGRMAEPKWLAIHPGDYIRMILKDESFVVKVSKVVRYYEGEFDPLTEYLIHEGINNCLPGVNTLKEAREVYLQYFRQEDIDQYGMVAIHLV